MSVQISRKDLKNPSNAPKQTAHAAAVRVPKQHCITHTKPRNHQAHISPSPQLLQAEKKGVRSCNRPGIFTSPRSFDAPSWVHEAAPGYSPWKFPHHIVKLVDGEGITRGATVYKTGVVPGPEGLIFAREPEVRPVHSFLSFFFLLARGSRKKNRNLWSLLWGTRMRGRLNGEPLGLIIVNYSAAFFFSLFFFFNWRGEIVKKNLRWKFKVVTDGERLLLVREKTSLRWFWPWGEGKNSLFMVTDCPALIYNRRGRDLNCSSACAQSEYIVSGKLFKEMMNASVISIVWKILKSTCKDG